MSNVKNNFQNQGFLDEAGDTAFYGKGKKNIIGSNGVSNCFIIGMVKFNEPIHEIREKVIELQKQIATDPFFAEIFSINKKKNNYGFYFHGTDDIPEVRKLFYDYIKTLNCSFEAVVGRKDIERYETKHKGKEEYFYADMLSHLLKHKIQLQDNLVLHISERGKSTKNINLEYALEKAKERFVKSKNLNSINEGNYIFLRRKDVKTNISFNVSNPVTEPLLNIADYFCWAVQRVLERGETRYYNFLKEKISLVVDVYDDEKYEGKKNYYGPENPLTAENKISPQLH
jgi:hypothetical protein